MKVARGTLQDVYVSADRAAVMVDEQVLVLSALATSILRAVPEDGAVNLEWITANVEAEFGPPEPPETAADLTLAQVHDLAAHGVLVLENPPTTVDLRTGVEAVDALRSALRHIVSGDDGVWPAPPGLTRAAFVAAAHQHHVVPFLDLHVDRLVLPSGTAAFIRAAAAQSASATEVLASDLAVALTSLERAGVRALAVKGVSLAVQAYDDLTARGAGDLDLLVAPADLARAHQALTSAGWVHDESYPAPGDSWGWRHLVRTGHEVSLHGSRSSVDLHWHLAPARSSFPSFERLWERSVELGVAGRPVPTLAPFDALAHSAGHAAKDQWRWLRSMLDVHRLASEPRTWEGADRPLRSDQLLTLGLAARMFGVPHGAPAAVVRGAIASAGAVHDDVVALQAGTPATHESAFRPGKTLATSVRTLRRTEAAPADLLRQLGFSLFPPWLLAGEPSPHAYVAAPRAVWRRGAGVVTRLGTRLPG